MTMKFSALYCVILLFCALNTLLSKLVSVGNECQITPYNEISTSNVNLCSMKLPLPRNLVPLKSPKSALLYQAFLLLSNSQDIELNPGPVKYPCQICHKAVKRTTPGVCCDNCDQLYHQDCMRMNFAVYASLVNAKISWHCVQCGMPNFSTSLFETTNYEDANSFTLLVLVRSWIANDT